MKKVLGLISSVVLATSLCASEKVDSLDSYLNSVKISGDLRLGYLTYDYKNEQAGMGDNSYDTSIGGSLKFDFPIYRDNAKFVVAPYFAKSFGSLSDEDIDSEFKTLASKDGDYMMIGEANLDLSYENFGLVVGRQIINTPLMGDDDLRLTHQTFQGVMANYNFEHTSLYAGYFNRWQGYDAGLLNDNKGFNDFQKMGTAESDGTALAGIEYENSYSFSNVASRLYYYDIDKYSKVFYGDVSFNNEINDEVSTDFGFQYTNQSEQNDSGQDASLYGAMFGLGYNNLYFYSAYTKSSVDENKALFNGFGGEFYYTAMNEWAMGYLTEDEKALQFGLSYDFNDDFNISAYTTTFKTDSEKIKENDLLVSYSFSEKLMAEAMYFNVNDEKDDDNSYDIFFARLTYSF